jgi:hypothetical protein
LIAQEKMAANTVYVFEKKDAKYSFQCEIKCVTQNASRPARYKNDYSRTADSARLASAML